MKSMIHTLRKRAWRSLAAAGLGATALLAACGGGGGGGTGTLQVSLTDAPACGFDNVYVTVQKVSINQSANANANDAGWVDITLPTPTQYDLLSLHNGVLATLGQTPLPEGHYTQMRLVLAPNDATHPDANSVVVTNGTGQPVPLTVPSGIQSGIKLNVDIDVAANQLADVVLDFNACKSIVTNGAGTSYLLKPVIAVTPNYISGVQGYVDTTTLPTGTTVSLEQGGAVISSTMPDSSGKFLLEPVAPGTYDVVITAPGDSTEVITDVAVVSQTVTLLNTSTSALKLTSSGTGTLNGAVTTGASPVDARVDVMQALSSTRTIDVAGGPVNGTTGAFSYVEPTGAPLVAPFVAPLGALNFAAVATAAGNYSLVAASGTSTKSASLAPLTAGATVTTSFTF